MHSCSLTLGLMVPTPPCTPPHAFSTCRNIPPSPHTTLQNFLYMLDAGSHPSYRPNPRLARALDILFILHAEHELNCRRVWWEA